MFADDLLLFGQASVQQMKCALQTIDTFCHLSGQQVNLSKTSIMYSKNADRDLRRQLNRESGFKEVGNLGKYLGVPLLGRAPKKADYQYLTEKINQKLVGWKAKHLSLAGRTTLAKAVIEAMPIYLLMVASIPKGVIHEIQKRQR